jgi:transposase-like protein
MDLVQAGKLTEEQAREYFERIFWPSGPVCPHCKGQSVGKLDGEKHRTGLYQCYNAECSQQFTVTVGTVLEDTHIPLQKWVLAFLLMNSSKKGISALQLKRNLGLGSYKTAWHMCHRIRHAMSATGGLPELDGEVEIDETYVGGKPRKIPGVRAKCGRGTKKTPVVALIQRNGPMRAMPVQHVTIKNLKNVIHQHVRKDAVLMTDELPAYRKIGRGYASHKRVVHSRGEYARDGVSVNSCESFFALLKRGVHGTFHHVSKKHLHRYCDEFSFRWEHRKATDGERTVRAIAKSSGKRLTYKQPKEAS